MNMSNSRLEGTDKPNVLFIMSDQIRHDALGCNGNRTIKTPNFDRLAESGVNFKNAFTPDPICVPARACLATGFYPHKCIGSKENKGIIKKGFPLIAEEFNKRGYKTYAMGKLHYHPYMPPGRKRTTHGFKIVELSESGRILKKYDPAARLTGLEEYIDYLKTVGWGGYSRGNGLGNNDVFAAPSIIPEEHYVDKWVTDRTLHYLKKHMESYEEPFFMFTSFPKPHSPFDPPRPYDTMYDPRDMPDPVGNASMLEERRVHQFHRMHIEYEWDELSPEAKKTIKAYYYGLISFQDKQVGRLLDFLEKNALRENTVVVYTGDHGEMLGDFGLYHKKQFYNGAVHIPMIISFPGKLPHSKVAEELTGLQDLLPTLMALTGIPLVTEVDGHDLAEVMFNNRPVRDYYVSQCGNSPKQQYMVCSKDWKYIYHEDGGIEELFNIRNDPDELNNLSAAAEPGIEEVKKNMRDYLIKWCIDNEDNSMISDNELVRGPQLKKHRRSEIAKIYGRRYY